MGSAGAKLSKTEEQLVDQKRYSREPIIPYDIRYGDNIRVYKQLNSAQRVAIIQKVFDTQILYQATLDIQKVLAKLKHPGMIQLINIVTKKKEQLCSQFYKVKFLYEFVDNDLQKDMELRRQLERDLKTIPSHHLTSLEDLKVSDNQYKIHYEESELWYIIATVIAVLSYLKERNLIHGDIRPFNLCLTSDNVLKVMTINSYIQTNWSSYMEKLEKLDTTSTYISPIQLGALQHNVQRPIHNVPKSDSFCLGVIMLELCLLESAQDIYDFTTYRIDLSQRIKKIKEMNKYSDHFINFLIQMLNLNEEQRKSPEELYQIIAELAKQQEISVSNRIFSLERVLQIVNKWKQKNQPVININPNGNLQQDQNRMQNMGMQGLILPEKIFDQGGQQVENNQTEDELPNQEDGEVIQELGLLNKDNKDNNSNSFSIQKSANNISPSKRPSEDINKNNISIQSGHQNDSLNKIKKDLSGDFRQAENKENLFFGRGATSDNLPGNLQRNMSQNQLQNVLNGNPSSTNLFDPNNQNINNNQQQSGLFQRSQSQYFQNQQNIQNQGNKLNLTQQNQNNFFGSPQQQQQQQQFGQSQFSNNLNMFQGSTGTFGGAGFNQQNQVNNNSLFGVQNFNANNNVNNQFSNNQNINNNSNNNISYQQQLLVQQMLQQQQQQQQQQQNNNSVNQLAAMLSNPAQMQILVQQLQSQNMQMQQNNMNNIQQHPPMIDLNTFGKAGNMYSLNNQQSNMSPTFNNPQNINFQMNRAGGFTSHSHQNSHMNQNTSFYSANNVGGYNSNNQFSNPNINQQQQTNNQFSNMLQSNNVSAAQSQMNLFNNPNTFNAAQNNPNNNSNLFIQNNNNASSNTNLFPQNTISNNTNVNANQSTNLFGKMNSLTNQGGAGAGGNMNYSQNVNIAGNNNPNLNMNANASVQLQAGGQQQSQTNIFNRNNRSIF